ncbi:MAG: primosomal protein N' [Bacteroidetes bacterium]|nr:primosomal protein N' [Bacteroidota bacterium]
MVLRLADIALPVPVDRVFTYLVPPELAESVAIGKRVLVPFGRQHLTGVVVALPASSDVKGLKPIRDVVDGAPSFSDELLQLTKWIGEYYFAPWGEVLRAATPQGLSLEGKRMVTVNPETIEQALAATAKRAPKQHAALNVLRASGSLSLSQLEERCRTKGIHAVVLALERQGWVRVAEEIERAKAKPRQERGVETTEAGILALKNSAESMQERQRSLLSVIAASNEPLFVKPLLRDSGYSLSTLSTLAKKGLVRFVQREVLRISPYDIIEPPPDITLNPSQEHVLSYIMRSVEAGEYHTYLLHGVTGSGKTQVYIEAMRKALSLGKNAIVLVPEIALTPQTVRRFKSHFGNDVAVMHSQMSVGERYDTWRSARDGRVRIVIGPRSAIFAPLANIGLIVVDEEHEGSYKQYDATPRYHARDVAIMRAVRSNATVVLGSATPSVESYHNAVAGKYTLLELSERVDNARMPTIAVVDIAKERRRVFEALKEEVRKSGKEFPKRLPDTSISGLLAEEIRARIARTEGVILLQNRRGFSHVMECYDCGYVERCDSCEVSLTYHLAKKHLRCHYCGSVKKPPGVCPKCEGTDMRMHAFGTQQVHKELKQLFPQAIILRMDRDTTVRKGAHDAILSQFGAGKADILLGTQMVAKGLDFPRVTLVGVISADTQMLLPDFRASEQTFQLLTQVSGRAGRSTLAGEVVIQTLQPQHYSLKHVVVHDFKGFYQEEIAYRKELDYPPFSRLVLIEFSGGHESEVQHHAHRFAQSLNARNVKQAYTVLGPADAAIPKLRDQYRKHIVVKNLKTIDPGGGILRAALLTVEREYEGSQLGKSKKVKHVIDVDPVGMM